MKIHLLQIAVLVKDLRIAAGIIAADRCPRPIIIRSVIVEYMHAGISADFGNPAISSMPIDIRISEFCILNQCHVGIVSPAVEFARAVVIQIAHRRTFHIPNVKAIAYPFIRNMIRPEFLYEIFIGTVHT